jgi:antitoxin ParD1/3/4
MPTRNVNLTDTLDHFIIEKVKSGRYENASEVMRAALRALERDEREYEAKLAALRSAIDAGDSRGIARGDVSVKNSGASLGPTSRGNDSLFSAR